MIFIQDLFIKFKAFYIKAKKSKNQDLYLKKGVSIFFFFICIVLVGEGLRQKVSYRIYEIINFV